MCLAVPMQLESRQGSQGVARYAGGAFDVRLDFLPEAAPGDYLLVHTGMALEKMRPEDALELESLLAEVQAAGTAGPARRDT
ncbi:MAG: HypC/HybG/HupF family hydrogenase formation chaperone [Lentisphaeria bacterium]